MKMLNIKKLIALVLSVSLLFGVVSTSVSADEALADDTTTTTPGRSYRERPVSRLCTQAN